MNLIALVAAVAVVSACSTDDKKGSIVKDPKVAANRTANSKGKTPALSTKIEIAKAQATVESPVAAEAIQPSLVDAAYASYELLTNAGSIAFRAALQSTEGNVQDSMVAGRDAMVLKMNEISAANLEAVALALVMIGDNEVSSAFYEGQSEVEAIDLAMYTSNDGKLLDDLSSKIQANWESKKSEAQVKFDDITALITKDLEQVDGKKGDVAFETAGHNASIDSLNKDLAAQKALIAEYQYFLDQVAQAKAFADARVQAITPVEAPASTETPAETPVEPIVETPTETPAE